MSEKISGPLASKRIIELDWLRVLAFGLLIFYHIGMLYTQDWGWHYKSQYQSQFLANLMLWSNQWRMPLLFFISGAALFHLLQKYRGWDFIRRRVPLLALPWIFGTLAVVVPQVYVEANSQNLIPVTNYWHFWYIYLDQTSVEFAPYKTLGHMHLTWNHLWFLPYILAYSLILWFVYPLIQKPWFEKIFPHLRLWHLVLLPIVGIYLIGFFLYKDHPLTHNFVDDWFNHARSFFAFLLGFGFVQIPRLWRQFIEGRWYFLILASLSFSYCLYVFHGGSIGDNQLLKEINGIIWSANLWLWILVMISWAQKLFQKSSPILEYLNRGVFCFYVLHQTLIIVIAYFLAPLALGPLFEPLTVISLTILSCLLGYEILRRIPYIRILFGIQMK